MWVDVVPDNCTCAWVNKGDNTGWELRNRNRECPDHGDHPQPRPKDRENQS